MPRVYLAGPMSGLTAAEAKKWRDYVTSHMNIWGIECHSPLRGKHFLEDEDMISSQASTKHVLGSANGITNRDRDDVLTSDLVLANLLGAKSVSIGTMFELAWADLARVPVIVVMEKDGSNPHDHLFVKHLNMYHVDNLDDAMHLTQVFFNRQFPFKSPRWNGMSDMMTGESI